MESRIAMRWLLTAFFLMMVSSIAKSTLSAISSDVTNENVSREGKKLNGGLKIFSNPLMPLLMIHVKPNPCSTDSGLKGVCYSHGNCTERGGEPDGKCANGFGVCCRLEQRCGAKIKVNGSILVNNEYPEPLVETGNCQYIITKTNENICQLRLDFEKLVLAEPNQETSLCEEDALSVVGTAAGNPRVICGVNSGQHMYVNLASGSSTARINIAATSSGKERFWRIKVAQIECNSEYRAPQNCLQYFTEYSGIINSFNYQPTGGVHQIGGMSYVVCVRAREGYCGITYQSDDFSLSGNATDEEEALSGDDYCTHDFVSIFVQDKTGNVFPDRFCGTRFNDTSTYSKPFQIRVITDQTEPSSDVDNRGFSLKYMQIPC